MNGRSKKDFPSPGQSVEVAKLVSGRSMDRNSGSHEEVQRSIIAASDGTLELMGEECNRKAC